MPEPLDDTFVRARDIAFSHGFLTAIDYDTDDWLSVAEEAGGEWRGIWHFAIPDDDPAERIAWAAMRSSWMEKAPVVCEKTWIVTINFRLPLSHLPRS